MKRGNKKESHIILLKSRFPNSQKGWIYTNSYWLSQTKQEIIKESFPFPNIEETLLRLKGSLKLSTIDLRQGFYQIEMDSKSIPHTTFVSQNGHYEFTRMLFGLVNTPSTFQRIIQDVLENIHGVTIYIEDLLIHTKNGVNYIHKVKKTL